MLNVKFDLRSTFDTKKLVGIIGGVVGLASSILMAVLGITNPVGWVVLVIGAVTSF